MVTWSECSVEIHHPGIHGWSESGTALNHSHFRKKIPGFYKSWKRQVEQDSGANGVEARRCCWPVYHCRSAWAPMLTVSIHGAFPALSGISEPERNGQSLSPLGIRAISVLFSPLKLLLLFRLVGQTPGHERGRRLLGRIHAYGRRSTLDAPVVAGLIVAVWRNTIASVGIDYDRFLFAAAAAPIMCISERLVHIIRPSSSERSTPGATHWDGCNKITG